MLQNIFIDSYTLCEVMDNILIFTNFDKSCNDTTQTHVKNHNALISGPNMNFDISSAGMSKNTQD